MIRTQLETPRLRLRHFTPFDVQIMFELNSDPEVIRYAESTPTLNLDEARERLQQGPLDDYRKYGYGRFAVELKTTGEVIGFCGIKYLPEIDLPEVGYRFLKAHWGKGYGTESARACVDFAREDLEIKKLIALIMPDNSASINIAEKLGMRRGALINIFDTWAYQYEMRL